MTSIRRGVISSRAGRQRYVGHKMKELIEKTIKEFIPSGFPAEISIPAHSEFGHYSTNVAMRLAPIEKKAPLNIAEELKEKILNSAPKGLFSKIETVAPGFLNFWLSDEFLRKELLAIYKNKKKFGRSNIGKGKRIIVEHSSNNIAKPMHVGHLRNTILGDSLANVFEALGYKVVRWNYLGDWGTQFGKLIVAYKLWGNRKEIEKEPIAAMTALYIKFHDEAKSDETLEVKAREEFQKLESGNKENRKLWEWFKKESLLEFKKMYKLLGAEFDVWLGESFYERQMTPLIAEMLEKGIAVKSEGAVVIPLDKYNLLPGLIQKSDGASLYLTRDIANIRYRLKKYKPAKILYVIGNEQTFQFEQLFAVANILGLDKLAELHHIKYGLVLAEGGKKFSTREGRVVSAEEVIDKVKALAKEVVSKKNPEMAAKKADKISESVGVGALKYFNLKEHRHSDIVFDWEKMLSLSGQSGPYLQYTFARLSRVIKKAKRIGNYDLTRLSNPEEMALVKKLLDFPEEIEKSAEQFGVNNITLYLYELANLGNRFYETTPILKDADKARLNARLVLIDAVRNVLKTGLSILGISSPEEI
ncbi:MAG: arginyl-tRNA synthetase [Parcubacteria group bacterium LiPW_15]|nr:MAG: arginyl-tRNA synthetase [Parcubacteria group bacterium LiPW_15]